jgi:hypothetical protein
MERKLAAVQKKFEDQNKSKLHEVPKRDKLVLE